MNSWIAQGSITDHIYTMLVRLYDKYSDSTLKGRLLQCLGNQSPNSDNVCSLMTLYVNRLPVSCPALVDDFGTLHENHGQDLPIRL